MNNNNQGRPLWVQGPPELCLAATTTDCASAHHARSRHASCRRRCDKPEQWPRRPGTAGGKTCSSPTISLYYYSRSMDSLLSQLNVPLMNHCAQLPSEVLGPHFAIDGSLRMLRVNTFCLRRLISHATCTQDPSSLPGVDWRASSLPVIQSPRLSASLLQSVRCYSVPR